MVEPQSNACNKMLLQSHLMPLLHPDVIPLVLDYCSMIRLEFVRSYGVSGKANGALSRPCGIVTHGQELLVADTWNERIQVFHQDTGRFLRKWGLMRGAGARSPFGLQIDLMDQLGQEEVLVLDGSGEEIQVFRLSDSLFLRRFRTPVMLGKVNMMAVLGDEIFLSCTYPSRIDVVAKSNGEWMRSIGKPGKEAQQLSDPSQLFVEPLGNELFIADSANYRIQVLDLASGIFTRRYGDNQQGEVDRLGDVCGVVVHGEQVIVGDCSNSRVVVFDRASAQILVESPYDLSRRMGGFSHPRHLAVNTRNHLFVSDCYNDRILMFE